MEVVGKNLTRASSLPLPLFKEDIQFILKSMLPESVESVLEDLVGFEHVVDGGHGVVGLEEDDVVEFGRQRSLRSSDRLSSDLKNVVEV